MIEIGKRKKGKFCTVVKRGKEKYYVCTDDPEKKEDIYYVAYLVENGYKSGVVKIGNKIKVFTIKGSEVAEREEELEGDWGDLESYLSVKFTDAFPAVIPEDIEKLKRKYSTYSKVYISLAGISLLIFLIGVGILYWNNKKEEEIKRIIQESRKERIVRLSPEQRERIKKDISQTFIRELAYFINTLPELQRIKSVSLKYVTIPPRKGIPEKLYGEMTIVIESVYPIQNSRKSGKFFLKTIKKKLEVKNGKTSKSGKVCMKKILEFGGELEVTNPLSFRVVLKDTMKAFKFLEEIYGCPFYFTQVYMGEIHSFKLVVN